MFNLQSVFYTARRPLKGGNGVKPEPEMPANPFAPVEEEKKKIQLKSHDLMTYDPVIMERYQAVVSYSLELAEINNVKAFATQLESTS